MWKLIKSAVSNEKINELATVCASEFEQSSLIEGGYPGITLKATEPVQFLSQFMFDTVNYDFSFGTGANYIYAPRNTRLSVHIDKPLYELDEKYCVKPEFDNRCCVGTVILGLGGTASIEIVEEEDKKETVSLSAGDVLVLSEATAHQLLPVDCDLATMLCGFYCSNIQDEQTTV